MFGHSSWKETDRRCQCRTNQQRPVDGTCGDGCVSSVDPPEPKFLTTGMADDCESSSGQVLTRTPASVRKTAWLLFAGVFATYLALAPGTVAGRGYVWGDMQVGMGVLTSFNAWVKGRV